MGGGSRSDAGPRDAATASAAAPAPGSGAGGPAAHAALARALGALPRWVQEPLHTCSICVSVRGANVGTEEGTAQRC